MKTTKLLVGALSLLTFAACSDDKDTGIIVPDGEQFAKIRVDIVSNAVSGRADETFVDGTAAENNITSARIVFYDANGNPMTTSSVTAADATKDSEGGNVELVKTFEAKVTLPDGRYPSYMMVFVNPISGSEISSLPIANLKTQVRNSYQRGTDFAMNNAVYFNTDGSIQREVAVSQENFYQTDEEAASAPTVRVYIERLAAKVRLTSTDGDAADLGNQTGTLENEDGQTSHVLKFTATGWGLNATARNCYLSKVFLTEAGNPWNYSDMNSSFGFDWNDPTRHRSYWAFTPHYYMPETNMTNGDYKFPFVSDQVNDAVNRLDYISYNDLEKAAPIDGSLYTFENTVASALYNDQTINTNAALVSAVVTGYYTVDNEIKDFYIHGKNIYLKQDYLIAMSNYSNVIVKEDGTVLDDPSVLEDIFEIYHPTTPIGTDATKGVEENKVTIRFRNTAANRQNYKYKSGSNDPVEITAALVPTINEDLQAHCGLASAYTGGKAYFNVPIRHLAKAPTGTNTAWAPGAFGVVRNHYYVVNVSGFAELDYDKLGHGVLDPNKPVVPPGDPNDDFGIKADIRVLAWRVVNNNVILGDKIK